MAGMPSASPLSPHWQVEALMERVEELSKDKVRLVEEYEAKLAKAQECYERELEAMRRTHQLTTENLLAWKRTEVRVHGTLGITLPYSSHLQNSCNSTVQAHASYDLGRYAACQAFC